MKLSNTEYQILTFLWGQNHRLSAKEISQHFDWPIKKTNSYLKKMHKKGALKKEANNKYYLYSANITENQCDELEILNFFNEQCHSSIFKFIATLLGESELTESEKEELRKLLD